MTNFEKLQEGQIITFTKIPTGSWLSAGVKYLVEWKDDNSAYFRNAMRGSGTYDKAWAINQAIISA